MRAFSKAGSPILGTLDTVQSRPEIVANSWGRDEAGALTFEHAGGSEMFWDTSETVTRGGPKDAADEMLAALRQWKCPGCGGKGTYQQNAVGRERDEARGRTPDPAFAPDPVTCKVCSGNGLHPIAGAAIAKAETAPVDVFLDAAGNEVTADEIELREGTDGEKSKG